ncbi:hypothetical protein [Streptomyces pseudovenezuelae]|uniref:hypothetical protein n=1 Tax=Streptomyces pseudovenezuelae TaxID=67350 RepID=UPI002E381393|nr:hypothetical protein [Streptomyces pseudovenezuelae]
MSTDTGHAAIVHWRRSIWNGARCEPVLLTLRPDGLQMQDRFLATVLRTDAHSVTGRLTRLGTLLLTIDGRRYALVGRAASLSPAPSTDQKRALANACHGSPQPAAAGGAVDQVFNGGAGARMHDWHARLAAAGARLT